LTNSSSSSGTEGESPAQRLLNKVGMAVVIEVLAGLVIGVLALVFSVDSNGDTPSSAPTTEEAPTTYWPETEAPPLGVASETELPDDPLADPAIGDCFENYGEVDDFDLEPSGCDAGAFEVVEIYSDVNGTSACDGVDESMFGHDPGYGSVLCLSYLHPWGEAYYAESGDCITRADDDTYLITDCEPGVYRVLETFWDERDSDRCSEWEYYNGSLDFPGYWDEQDLLLCMRIEYPDDMGFATVDHCMYASGSEGDRTFEFTDCDQANIYVTGRTPDYNAQDFCDGYGWATWQSGTFPDYAYTVCWAWY
jgi:hypothetical protein